MNWRDLVAETQAVWRVPEVAGERCVHTRLAAATCRRCVDACPTVAWVLDDDQLGIDPSRCDGCGLCVAACSEGALAQGLAPEVRRLEGEKVVFAACERSEPGAPSATVPCLHAFGMALLAELYGGGVRRFLLCRADCDQCPRGAGERLSGRLGQLNRVLKARALPPVTLQILTRGAWQQRRAAAKVHDGGPDWSRRKFLRHVIAAAAEAAPPVARAPWRPPGQRLPPTTARHVAFHAPMLDERRCSGCDACVRVCPHGAIGLVEDAGAYLLQADACTGCDLCVDVCDRDAVRVDHYVSVRERRIPLRQGRCRSCGADFHRPDTGPPEPRLCPICAQVDHRRQLFQVL